MCFDCVHRKIMETSHEWIECHCQMDGRWHNPYSPELFRECKNYEKENNNEGRNAEEKT